MNRTKSGKISLGQVTEYLRYVSDTGQIWYTNHDVEMAKATLYHLNKLRKIIRGFHVREKEKGQGGTFS